MTYVSTHIKLTEKQIKQLHRGETIRIKNEHLHSTDPHDEIHVDKRQMHKLEACRLSKKGTTFSMSPEQVQHHKLRGSGKLSDLFRQGLDFVKDKALDGVNALGDYGIGKVVDAVAQPLTGIAPKFLSPYINMGSDIAKRYTKDKCKEVVDGMRSVHGSGFYSDDVSMPSMSNIHNNMVMRMPTHMEFGDGIGAHTKMSKIKKSKEKVGCGLQPPGY